MHYIELKESLAMLLNVTPWRCSYVHEPPKRASFCWNLVSQFGLIMPYAHCNGDVNPSVVYQKLH